MTMRARFIGDPRDNFSGAEEFVFFGTLFRKGEWRDVGEEELPRLIGHSHFEVEISAPDVTEPQPERITDLDTPPAPVKRGPGRPRKNA